LILKDKRIIVTGGAQGLGAAVVRECAANGAQVISMDVQDDLGEAVAREASATEPGNASYVSCDMGDTSGIQTAFAAAIEDLGGLDALIQNAAIEFEVPAENLSVDQWSRIAAINAMGTIFANQAAFPALKESHGSIVNVASVDAIQGRARAGHYAATKGAVLGWTRSVAVEWAEHGIRVNAVAPAADTPMYRQFRRSRSSSTTSS
jgi:NAD(P)-dependent dehydrogenase (short-subunit alcohol dehydrogenase family)